MAETRRGTGSGAAGGRSVSPAVAAAAGMVLWVVAEFALRRGVGYAVVAPRLGTSLGADAAIMVLGFPLIAAAVALVGRRGGVDPDDWDYEVSAWTAGAGLAGFLAYFVVFTGVSAAAYVLGFGLPGNVAGYAGADPAAWVLVAFLVGNGVVVPVAEELAWRGAIQTALTESYGTYAAVAVTAVGFVAKHLVVDLAAAPLRVVSLSVLALVLCGLRVRYGTASSTVAHVAANLVSTASLVVAL